MKWKKLLTSVESTTGESDFKEDKEIFFDETEKSSDAVKESLGKTGSFDEVEGSLDKVGKHSDDTEEHEVEVVLCKSDKVSDEIEGPGELDKGIAEVAVGPCLEGESLGKMEEGTGVVGEGPCSTEEGLDAVKESPGEMEEGFAETQVDPCMEGGSLGKVEEGLCVVGVGPCSAEESLDAVKESPGEMEEGSHEMEKLADSETTVSDIALGTCSATEATDDAILRPTITRHDSCLTTVIQGVILLSVLFFTNVMQLMCACRAYSKRDSQCLIKLPTFCFSYFNVILPNGTKYTTKLDKKFQQSKKSKIEQEQFDFVTSGQKK